MPCREPRRQAIVAPSAAADGLRYLRLLQSQLVFLRGALEAEESLAKDLGPWADLQQQRRSSHRGASPSSGRDPLMRGMLLTYEQTRTSGAALDLDLDPDPQQQPDVGSRESRAGSCVLPRV